MTRTVDHLTMNEVNLESEAFNRAFSVRSRIHDSRTRSSTHG